MFLFPDYSSVGLDYKENSSYWTYYLDPDKATKTLIITDDESVISEDSEEDSPDNKNDDKTRHRTIPIKINRQRIWMFLTPLPKLPIPV